MARLNIPVNFNRTHKKCKKCGETKPVSEFYTHVRDGWYPNCAECCREITRTPEYKAKANPRLRRYRPRKNALRNAQYRIDNERKDWAMIGYRRCTTCFTAKPLTEFSPYVGKAPTNTRNGTCKPCKKNSQLRRLFGVTLEWYVRTLKSQEDKCAICRTVEPGGPRKAFHVDHCHVHGTARGLLCNCCNLGIGTFRDTTEYISRAISYLAHKGTDAALQLALPMKKVPNKRRGSAPFNLLATAQHGNCAICKQPCDKLVFDHDHASGMVRGLLCNHCNSGLGLLFENLTIMREAVKYLLYHRQMKLVA